MIDHGLSRLRSGLAAGARKSGIGVLGSGNAGAFENARQADRNPESLHWRGSKVEVAGQREANQRCSEQVKDRMR